MSTPEDRKYRRILQNTLLTTTKNTGNAPVLLVYLCAEGVISLDYEKPILESNKTIFEQMNHLYGSILPTKPYTIFPKLLKALEDSENGYIAKCLREEHDKDPTCSLFDVKLEVAAPVSKNVAAAVSVMNNDGDFPLNNKSVVLVDLAKEIAEHDEAETEYTFALEKFFEKKSDRISLTKTKKESNSNDVWYYEVLKLWVSRTGKQATWNKLIQNFEELKWITVVENLKDNKNSYENRT